MKEKRVLYLNALYKYYHNNEDMWREFTALQECEGRWVQKVLQIDKPGRIISFVFYPHARDLFSFEDHDIALLVNILPDVIRAISHCHNNGWVHGDIKPSNILFTPRSNSVRLIDFSASQRIGTDRLSLLHWQASLQFSCNRQYLGTGIVSPEDDWFSLKEMVTQVQEKKQSKQMVSQLTRILNWLDYKLINHRKGT